jgi:murein DD-endopeptidase MepM/ murein hydrolase activator NlpD
MHTRNLLLVFVFSLYLAACGHIDMPLPTAIPASLTPAASQTPVPPTSTNTNTPLPPTETPVPPTSTPAVVPWTYAFPVWPLRYVSYAEGYKGHGYPAIDIFAPAGYEFRAVTDGVVEFVSYEDKWDPATDDPALRSGLAVAIIGDDGWRYYGSHLSAIAKGISPGLRVSAGQLLGSIGETGNARGRGTHLHFGISHPTFPQDWKVRRGEVDPLTYLDAWKNGENLTPILPKDDTPTPN